MYASDNLEYFSLFLEHIPGAIAMFDTKWRYLIASEQWMTDYGLTGIQLQGLTLSELTLAHQIDTRLLLFWQAVEIDPQHPHKIHTGEDYFLKPDGSKEWVEWTLKPWYHPTGSQGGVIISSRFSTPWKQQEEILRQTEARFLKLSCNIPGMIFQFLMQEDGSVTYPFVSSGCRELFNLEPEEVQNDPKLIIDRIHPDDRESHDESVNVSARLLMPFYWEGRYLDPSGKVKWIEASSQPEKQSDGTVLWDGIILDITPRKITEIALQQYQNHLTEMVHQRTAELTQTNEKLQQEIQDRKQKAKALKSALTQLRTTQAQLIQTEKMSSLGQLVAGVAHEINNPINFIAGNLNHLEHYIQDLFELLEVYRQECDPNYPEIEEIKEEMDLEFLQQDIPHLISSMKVGSERIHKIVLSLQNFTRHDEAQKKLVNLNEGVESTLMLLQYRFKETANHPAIQLVKNYGDLPKIECYPGQFNQVLMNLITNALEAINRKKYDKKVAPILEIATLVIPEKAIQVKIKDNGIGIPQKIQTKVFDPFFTTKTIGDGSGLGLTVSHQIIVEKHRGQLIFTSTEGEGTEFVITLPF